MRYHSTLLLGVALQLSLVASLSASTAAYQGTVTNVEPSTHQDTLVQFTCNISYFDYISWGKFNGESKVGEPITRQVKRLGTAAMINGRLVNVATFSAAIKPGQWGYFYEDTWLDLHTTPDFQWGEVVSHDPAKKVFTLRIHKTHKDYHLAANPPETIEIPYDDKAAFRLEAEAASVAEVLQIGHWVQVHPPRGQMVNVWSAASAFDPSELLPADQGKRGFANDLTAPATLVAIETKTPDAVIDLACDLTVTQPNKSASQPTELACRKTSFILDGKLCPAAVAVRPGRRAVLGHYRSEKTPHKVFVQSQDDAIRGVIQSINGQSAVVTVGDDEVTVALSKADSISLDGLPAPADQALKAGREIVVYPRRGWTMIGFGK